MNFLILGLLIFFGVHLVPSAVSARQKLISHLGEGAYKGFYSILALVGLVLIVYGKSKAEYQPIWEPPVWGANVVIAVMVISAYLLVAADMKSNIKRVIRHPMLWGIALWSGSHLLANGDLASILLFGSFCIFSLFGMYSANSRGAKKQTKTYPVKRDIVAVVSGIVAYTVFINYLHPYFFGVSVV